LFARDGPSATAAFHYEAADAAARLRARIVALAAILRKELGRTRAAEQRVREGLRSFEDPDRYRRMGEALLAGLRSARRSGGIVYVPDPYDEGGRELSIPATPGRTLAQVADELFQRQRRSRRGLISGAARAETLARQASRLERLLVAHERLTDPAGVDALESDMRAAGLPVGLIGPTRASRAAALVTGPQLSGVRMVTSADGWTILVGRTGPDNDRLTFKIAAPDDFWLHAAGVPGAHVVIRNPERLGAAPAKTLAQAAGLALWFSDARSQGVADVQCTRRRNVRRAKGGRSGLVVLKRFETIRARAAAPPEAF
jgi:predicted ribosome quality control (RQC) complex YloA/Tae2 family protein